MSTESTRENVLDAYGPILIKQGYDWVDLDEVADAAAVKHEAVQHVFTNKALLCESWMERTDERAKKHHEELLSCGKMMSEVLEHYFAELDLFMSTHSFGGCPFTNTARALRGKPEPLIEARIKQHKEEVRGFFIKLCRKANIKTDVAGEALFLIYSGATTESANLKSMKPITAGRKAAMSLFDMYAA